MKKFLIVAAFLATFMTFTAAFASVEVLFVTNCNESITLRDSPSAYGNEIAQIPLNQGVVFIEDAGNGFYRVNYGRHTGYALADYLTSKDNIFVSLPRLTATQKASLYEGPSTHTEQIAIVGSGDWVWYIGDGYFSDPNKPDFYLVEFHGTYGYISVNKVIWK